MKDFSNSYVFNEDLFNERIIPHIEKLMEYTYSCEKSQKEWSNNNMDLSDFQPFNRKHKIFQLLFNDFKKLYIENDLLDAEQAVYDLLNKYEVENFLYYNDNIRVYFSEDCFSDFQMDFAEFDFLDLTKDVKNFKILEIKSENIKKNKQERKIKL